MRAPIVFFALAHAFALATMALLLRPGMDAAAFSVAERAAYVASHPLAWRLGWLPWQLSALSDLWLSIAIWRSSTPSAQRPARAALALFVVSAVPEQWAEAMLAWDLPSRVAAGPEAWQRDWALYAAVTGVWANWGYTAMTYCWMRCAARMVARPVWPKRWENALLGTFVVSGGLYCWMRCAARMVARPVWPKRWENALLGTFVVSGGLTGVATLLASPSAVGAWFSAAGVANGVAFPALVAWSLTLYRRLGAVA
jgi:hypothetical protein